MTERQPQPSVRLARETRSGTSHSGGSVTWRVYLDERWVGWVGDGRDWKGWRYGGRKWFACWREEGDTAARWSPGLTHRTRTAAVAALVEQITASR